MQFPLTGWVANLHRDQLLADAERSRQYSHLRYAGTRYREHLLACKAEVLALVGLWWPRGNERTSCSEPEAGRSGC
jgi:hypothetical protein